jgi:hypothetical protein
VATELGTIIGGEEFEAIAKKLQRPGPRVFRLTEKKGE